VASDAVFAGAFLVVFLAGAFFALVFFAGAFFVVLFAPVFVAGVFFARDVLEPEDAVPLVPPFELPLRDPPA
jgi:hypothetical protein